MVESWSINIIKQKFVSGIIRINNHSINKLANGVVLVGSKRLGWGDVLIIVGSVLVIGQLLIENSRVSFGLF